MITVYDVCYLFLEGGMQKVRVYDFAVDKDIYSGYIDDMPSNISSMEIMSIDNIKNSSVICFNVDSNEE